MPYDADQSRHDGHHRTDHRKDECCLLFLAVSCLLHPLPLVFKTFSFMLDPLPCKFEFL